MLLAMSGYLIAFFQEAAFSHFSFSTHCRVPGRGSGGLYESGRKTVRRSNDWTSAVRADRFFTDREKLRSPDSIRLTHPVCQRSDPYVRCTRTRSSWCRWATAPLKQNACAWFSVKIAYPVARHGEIAPTRVLVEVDLGNNSWTIKRASHAFSRTMCH